jgi:predicted nucleotide-binding protein
MVIKIFDMPRRKRILWVDDDVYYIQRYVPILEAEGYDILIASTLSEAKDLINNEELDAVITDIMLPPGDHPDWVKTQGGLISGMVLSGWIRKNHPNVPVGGLSAKDDERTAHWFKKYGAGFMSKYAQHHDSKAFIRFVKNTVDGQAASRHLKTFIVHGHDAATKYELKNYVQNTLGLGEPVILHERSSGGLTIIEKFEKEASDADVVFVLMTPDDTVYDGADSLKVKKRARQNVILELGYFLAKLQRKSGRVMVLYKGDVELPSDIAGLIFIDVTGGIEAAGEQIRRELVEVLTA